MSIEQLVYKYQSNRDYHLTTAYNETLVRSDFLDPFFELLGWDIKNNAGKSTNEREVILEEALKANASEHSKKPDYTFRLYSERKFFLEAKKPCVLIESNNETAKQIRRYGFTAKLKISVLSNFEYLIIYDTSIKVENDDTVSRALIKKYHYTEYISKFDEIKRLLGKESVYSGIFDDEWKYIENKLNQYSVDKLFLNQINEWRKLLGTEIYKYVPEFDGEQLNDVVQSYLNRILFLRVCEDRKLETYQTLLKFADENDFGALIKKFKEADKQYNSSLFDKLLKDKIIEDIRSVFQTVIKQLYYPASPYSFSVFSSDILGNIYETFLSEKLIVRNGTIELVKKPENLDKDIVTTPNFVVSNILHETIIPKCEGKTDREILNLKIADISCGSGAFLLEAFQLLNGIMIDYYLHNDRSKLIQTNIDTYKLPFKTKRELLLHCIYGVDRDYNAVEATKFGLLLKLLEGEDVDSTNKTQPVLPDLSNNIFYGNSLLNPDQVEEEKQIEINPFNFSSHRFDVIVGNPPYMKSEDMKNITPLELPLYKINYVSAYKQFDKYFLFLEQGLNLLTDDGILGYIVPSKFTRTGAGMKLRELLASHLKSIVSFGANQIFYDKTTYTCLLTISKQNQQTFQYAEIRELKDWLIRKNTSFSTKNTSDLNANNWVLIPPELINGYNKIITQSEKLVDLVGEENIFNGIQTSANDIYIFTPDREDKQYYYFSKKDVNYQIEKEITKPYFQTSAKENNLNTYRTFKPNARVVYPYKKVQGKVELIQLADIHKQYPFAYDYLQRHKLILDNLERDIKPKPQTSDEWHRYGRHQSLDNCGLPSKIIVGVLSVGDKYAVDTCGAIISSGGTAGYCAVALPENSKYSIYYIQAILNSKYTEWFSALYGEVFRGGYIARGTKVLKNLPVRKIDFTISGEKFLHDEIAKTQKELIDIHDKMDVHLFNKRILLKYKEKFSQKEKKLEELLSNLYNLGDDDSLIPLIKELYGTD
jgi:hypothetical protein